MVTTRARVPPPRPCISACASSGARKYLRRACDFAGDALFLLVGSCGTGRRAHEWLKDRQGQRCKCGRARRETRHVQQPSTRRYRTLRRWRPVKAPRTWARGAGPRAAARRVPTSCRWRPLKWPLPAMQNQDLCKNSVACFAPRTPLMRPSDAARRALSEPPRAFSCGPKRWACGGERLRGRGGGEERQPCFLHLWRSAKRSLRNRGCALLV